MNGVKFVLSRLLLVTSIVLLFGVIWQGLSYCFDEEENPKVIDPTVQSILAETTFPD